MPKKIQLEITKHTGKKYWKIDGKYYVPGKTSAGKKKGIMVWVEVNPKEYEQIIDELAEKVSKKTNTKKLIKQALYDLDINAIKNIAKEMKKEKPKVRHHEGCFYLSVGKEKIWLRE